MTARILVIGGNGQLASSLRDLQPRFAEQGQELLSVGRPAFDFDQPDSIEACLEAAAPALVVNAAAWTAVDAAETEQDGARRANDTGPARIAAFCAKNDTPFIHVSTDYVFDGLKGAPYVETDPTSPTAVYGATKRDGELKILGSGAKAIIFRTSWVYAPTGKNFVRTMLAASLKRRELTVVADQKGCPTAAADLADAIRAVAARVLADWRPDYHGIFHAAGAGWTTWHGLAVATFDSAARYGNPVPTVAPIATADWPTPAKRPPDSRLDCAKLAAVYGHIMPDWRISLDSTIDRLFAAG
jgi:dTDP-4-dehydrorhamnose reductase